MSCSECNGRTSWPLYCSFPLEEREQETDGATLKSTEHQGSESPEVIRLHSYKAANWPLHIQSPERDTLSPKVPSVNSQLHLMSYISTIAPYLGEGKWPVPPFPIFWELLSMVSTMGHSQLYLEGPGIKTEKFCMHSRCPSLSYGPKGGWS